MWARSLGRLCVRFGAVSQLRPGLWRRPAAVCAGRAAYSEPTRTCFRQSHGSSSAGPGGGAEDAPEPDENLPEFNINVLVNLLRQENGKDLCVIRVPPEMKYVEYFVIVGGTSTRHLQAMAQYILKAYKFMKRKNDPHVCIEGKDTDDWMCIDFGAIVVHFMLSETRETYELEKLWTLRSYDDQLSEIPPEILPFDFMFGLHEQKE
ncbi:mitochondrial assembly of ribosomal large subunit protein 1 [Anomaloglossus baeobatrachus]|uniref:mitochondrial assembly of ribosomal large subunit protein 1 n=1 Tax=Anomaloglossus baeobatrachus TaxID=238106 RepID=UPI003F5062BF